MRWAAALLVASLAASRAAAAPTVVSLTFDDTDADQTQVPAILDPYGMKATFYINSSRIGTNGYMTMSQVRALAADGHELGGHTIDHLDLATVSSSQDVYEICTDRQNLLADGFSPVSFAYPFGAYDSDAEAAAKSCGYLSARTVGGLSCSGCPAAGSIPPADPYAVLTPDSIRSGTTLSEIEGYVTDAEAAGGGWVPLVLHHVCSGCDAFSVTPDTLRSFVAWLAPRAAQGTVVETVGQVITGSTTWNAVPIVSGLSPAAVSVGDSSFTLSVSGEGFARGAVVRWNGASLATTYVGRSRLKAAVPAADLAAIGTVSVAVRNPPPGGGTSDPVSFRVAPRPGSEVSIFTAQAPGRGDAHGDQNPLEVGVRFRSDVPGLITGLRFYKAAGDDGTHVGHLWTDNGALLVAVTFTEESPSGWQTADLPTPVPIRGGAAYVASRFTKTGYAVTPSYFATAGVDHPPLHALQDGAAGPDGVYAAGSSPAFPTHGARGGNYWMDVLFVPNATPSVPPPSPPAAAVVAGLDLARVYPNPWRADRHAGRPVTIDRLPNGSEVRLYTLSGRWVATVPAPAGTASWDLRSADGGAAASGFYLYLIKGPGHDERRGVLAVIR